MVNKNLFRTQSNGVDMIKNGAGGKAISMDSRQVLAQIAATNCFNGTFYATAEHNLGVAKEAVASLKNDPEFIAKIALYSRNRAHMKDMPAFLTVMLSEIDKPLFRRVFRKVVDSGKMLRNVVQMARSGVVTGKKANMSAGTWRHAIQEWFDNKSADFIFRASVGNDPKMSDILRMARPNPNNPEKDALFGYILGREIVLDRLPEQVRLYEQFKKDRNGPIPDVDFRMLDSLGLGETEWGEIARKASWTTTRMNLNTFARHGVFKNESLVDIVAGRLRDRSQIEQSKVFPYQIYVAWKQTEKNQDIPSKIKDALQDAIEIAIDNVPEIPGKGFVCIDSSGSMEAPITGYRYGSTTAVSCVDVAGLIASSIVRKNRMAQILTFSDSAQIVNLNPRDTVTTNTEKLAKAGGGTNISAPLRDLNEKRTRGDWVLYVSDYESWMDSEYSYSYSNTGLSDEWDKFKSINPNARLICCDLTPRNNSQIKSDKSTDVLQVGGWSDLCFDTISNFINKESSPNFWVKEIESYEI